MKPESETPLSSAARLMNFSSGRVGYVGLLTLSPNFGARMVRPFAALRFVFLCAIGDCLTPKDDVNLASSIAVVKN